MKCMNLFCRKEKGQQASFLFFSHCLIWWKWAFRTVNHESDWMWETGNEAGMWEYLWGYLDAFVNQIMLYLLYLPDLNSLYSFSLYFFLICVWRLWMSCRNIPSVLQRWNSGQPKAFLEHKIETSMPVAIWASFIHLMWLYIFHSLISFFHVELAVWK